LLRSPESSLDQRIAGAAPAACVLPQNPARDEVVDVAQRGVRRGFGDRGVFRRRELALEAVQQAVQELSGTPTRPGLIPTAVQTGPSQPLADRFLPRQIELVRAPGHIDGLRINRSMAIRFEWDPEKAKANWNKHKVGFEQACDAFEDTMALDEPDEREDYGEERWNRIGLVEGRLLFVTYTERIDEETGDEIIRIISARPAERRERKRYDEA
jgi:uncharacterized DUF497 family protein